MSSIAAVLVLLLGLHCCSVGAHWDLLVWTSGLLSHCILVSVGFPVVTGKFGSWLGRSYFRVDGCTKCGIPRFDCFTCSASGGSCVFGHMFSPAFFCDCDFD